MPGDIHTIDPLDGERWDNLAEVHPRASFFHSSKWARVLWKSYGHRPHYLGQLREGTPGSLLPILEVNSPWKGRRGVTLPFSDECGLLCLGNADGHELIAHALELGRERGWSHFEIRGDIPGDPPPPWRSFASHEVDLTVGVDNLFAGLESRVRGAIRKAEKAGVSVRLFETLEGTQTFYALHCRTRRKHGVPPQPFSFFSNLFEHVIRQKSGFIMAAESEDRVIAASVFVHHGRTALQKFSASDQAQLHLRPNDLVMWEAMKHYADRGYSTLSMGRTAPSNEGLRLFKRGFGAKERIIKYFRYDFRRRAFVTGRDEKTGPLNKFLTIAPLPVLRIIGQTLYPHLD